MTPAKQLPTFQDHNTRELLKHPQPQYKDLNDLCSVLIPRTKVLNLFGRLFNFHIRAGICNSQPIHRFSVTQLP